MYVPNELGRKGELWELRKGKDLEIRQLRKAAPMRSYSSGS